MMRSLWTGATGMSAQQLNVDTIANNLANVNTVGYKKERMEFKSLLYETMQRADLDPANDEGRPVNLQVGHGVRSMAIARVFTTGSFETTDQHLDFAIEGDGFFEVQRGDVDFKYTRDGSFKASISEDGSSTLVTSEGYPIMSIDDAPIVIPSDVNVQNVMVDEEGRLTYTDADNVTQDLGEQIKLVQFSNPQGLEAVGTNLFGITAASGEPLIEADGEVTKSSRILQGVLEMSNVQVAREMVNLIIAQRAYESNSKVITTSDDMLNTANNLKR